jgi:hypothetical protein
MELLAFVEVNKDWIAAETVADLNEPGLWYARHIYQG